jgi:hypothetical protein
MLSSLPKLADKAFILGFFLPTLLFVLVIAALFYDQPWTKQLFEAASQKDGWDKFAYFVLVVWVFSILLMMINLIELQILEGYRWPVSKISRFKRAEVERFRPRHERFTALNNDWARLGDAFPADSKAEWEKLRKDLIKEFPVNPNDHLPTRLGNAIRAFETYSREVYGADSIPLWLHLGSVLPKEFQSALDDARAQVNCAINITVLAAIVVMVALARPVLNIGCSNFVNATELCQGVVVMSGWASAGFLLASLAAIVISRLAYIFSIELAYAWGDLVKAAFDCYLPALADKLGYKLPETAEQRTAFWQAVSEQAIYWKPLQPEQWKPAEKKAPPSAVSKMAN